MLPADLLTRNAEEAARFVILARLDAAHAAAARLADENDLEALHDFRVALRRTRSALDAFGDLLPRKLRRKPGRALRALQTETGAARDAEVALAWLEEIRPQLARAHLPGYRWVVARLSGHRETGFDKARGALAERFAAREKKLRAALLRLRVRLDVGDALPAEPCHAEDVAARLRTQADTLDKRLSAIGSAEDVRQVHRARIQVKRLRYLAEPLHDFAPQAATLVAQLKALQDALGELNDCYVLRATLGAQLEDALREHARSLDALARALDSEESDAPMRRELRRSPRSGIVALIKRVQTRTQACFETVQRDWLSGRGGWRPALEALCASLDTAARSGMEFERKYLLRQLPEVLERLERRPAASAPRVVPLLRLVGVREIEQGYLPGKRILERLRRERSAEGVRHLRTLKSGAGLRRVELEEAISAAQFEALWPATEGARLVKRRYVLEQHGRRYEIDRFLDRDLTLAEIELERADAPVELPAWLAQCVEREVTSERAYDNAALARAVPGNVQEAAAPPRSGSTTDKG